MWPDGGSFQKPERQTDSGNQVRPMASDEVQEASAGVPVPPAAAKHCRVAACKQHKCAVHDPGGWKSKMKAPPSRVMAGPACRDLTPRER